MPERVWIVEGEWTCGYVDDYGYPPSIRRRRYFSQAAAMQKAENWRNGIKQDWSGPIDPYDESEPHGYPPAATVRVRRSLPIEWEEAPDA